jgi:hypothetical protein
MVVTLLNPPKKKAMTKQRAILQNKIRTSMYTCTYLKNILHCTLKQNIYINVYLYTFLKKENMLHSIQGMVYIEKCFCDGETMLHNTINCIQKGQYSEVIQICNRILLLRMVSVFNFIS